VIPYLNFLYFLVLLYPVVPAAVLGFSGGLRLWYIVLATAAMVLVQYGGAFGAHSAGPLSAVAAFAVYESLLVYGFAALRRGGRRRGVFPAAVVLALLPLVFVKVQPLLLAHHLLPAVLRHLRLPGAALPEGRAGGVAGSATAAVLGTTAGFLGISYVTFRFLDVLVGLQDGLHGAPGPGMLVGYTFFFPALSSGPIDRYRRFAAEAARLPRGRDYAADVDAGLYRVAQGFLYKFVLAELIDRRWLVPLAPLRDPFHMWLYMYAYTLFLFFDFAGYSAFAIGISRFFGIHTPENFAAPFLARNFKDFWNRWFITLSWFLRDHVYMRFVLGAAKRKWFRNNRYAASYVGYMLTFLAMGLWHGLAPQYIAYGLYQGLMISANDFLSRWNRRRRLLPDNRLTRGLSILATSQFVAFGMLIFSGHLWH
jgi:membrane protein involved in D-alanine export